MINIRNRRGRDVDAARDSGFTGELGLSAIAVTGAGVIEPEPGWLYCNGATVSRATYKRLFDLIGTAYNTGGEAGTDFRLPDYRGRSLSSALDGQAAGGTRMAATRGTPSGVEAVALTKATTPKHVHGKGTLAIASGGSHTHTPSFHIPYIVSNNDYDTSSSIKSSFDGNGQENWSAVDGSTDDGLHTHPSGEFTGALATVAGASGTAHPNVSPVAGCVVMVRY